MPIRIEFTIRKEVLLIINRTKYITENIIKITSGVLKNKSVTNSFGKTSNLEPNKTPVTIKINVRIIIKIDTLFNC